jgi:hypothetical protein
VILPPFSIPCSSLFVHDMGEKECLITLTPGFSALHPEVNFVKLISLAYRCLCKISWSVGPYMWAI